MSRIPSLDTVSHLSRNDWEDLCAMICSTIYQAHRVEDRFGKGNGLDAWRMAPTGVEGWQFRRLENRLGDKQVDNIKDNIALAASRAASEMGRPLLSFCIVLNIDPEPGHQGAKGEIQRFEDLRAWALESHDVVLEYHGATWVRECLLNNPRLRPDLFENLSDAVAEAKREILEKLDSTKVDSNKINELQQQVADKLRVLLAEAQVHHTRASEFGEQEQYILAIRSWDDALRLVRGHGSASNLEGEILAILSGVQVLVGDLVSAETNARKAQELLGEQTSSAHYWWAVGNLAFSLSHSQEYTEAQILFNQVLKHYESEANIVEIARTVQQMAEACVQTEEVTRVLELGERLSILQVTIEQTIGQTQLTMGFIGTAGHAYMLAAKSHEQPTSDALRGKALDAFTWLKERAAESGLVRLELMARAQVGLCLWHMDRLQEAEAILREVVEQGDASYAKVLADAQFNRSLVLDALERHDQALHAMRDASRRYRSIGDSASLRDAEQKLKDLLCGA